MRSIRRLLVLLLIGVGFVVAGRSVSPAATFTADKTGDGITVKLDNRPLTEYLIRSGTKPILWPLIGPTGKPVTRSYPMQSPPGETHDHVHQRSFWFTHGDVNGISFWEETPKAGSIVHRQFVEVKGGDTARIVTRNDWMAPAAKESKPTKMLEDERTLVFSVEGDKRLIDFDVTLTASEGPVTFGDTKEGTFGLRMAETINVDAKKGGRIVNSDGKTNLAAWGQPAAWVDYHGPVDGEQVGIAILNHPTSFRYPTRWHVRPYGLFAANPFGKAGFEAHDGPGGAFTLEQGKSLTLKYRVILHRGDEKQAAIADAFAKYAK